jgi:hypothetical protein
MEWISFLNKALWISISLIAILWAVRFAYLRIKRKIPVFFYFIEALRSDGIWEVRIEAPESGFNVKIELKRENCSLYSKEYTLKKGKNRIRITSEKLDQNPGITLIIQSHDQRWERTF